MGKAKGGAPAEASAKSVALREELENLSCRFIVNLAANELASIERIGFQVEQAYVVAPHTDIGSISTFCAHSTQTCPNST